MNLRFPNKIASFFNCPTKGTKTTKVFVEESISHNAHKEDKIIFAFVDNHFCFLPHREVGCILFSLRLICIYNFIFVSVTQVNIFSTMSPLQGSCFMEILLL